MSARDYSDRFLKDVLGRVKTIAAVGVSSNTVRPSWYVSNYMKLRGYKVIGVNPRLEGAPLFGTPSAADLSVIPANAGDIQMVDIFRRSEHVVPIVKEAIAHLRPRGLDVVWMQIGVVNEEAEQLAQEAGLTVIMDRCPKMEYQRLMGELSWGGINSGIISSKLRR